MEVKAKEKRRKLAVARLRDIVALRDEYDRSPYWRPDSMKLYGALSNMAEIKESEVEAYFCERADKNGAFVSKFTDPSRRGAPDRIIFMPWGAVYFVEFKRPRGGRLAELQKQYREKLALRHTDVWYINTKAKVDAFFRVVAIAL